MGIGGSTIKKEIPPLTADQLKILLTASKETCKLYRNKRVEAIKKKKEEIINCLKKNNMDLARAKMNNILKDEDYISACEILDPIFEIVKERRIYIISNNECPAELRAHLDTLLYAATRLEIESLTQFREKIIQKYGIAYVTKADNNADKLVDQNLVEKLQVSVYSQEMINIRLRQLGKQKNINIQMEGMIPGGVWEPNLNTNQNPYDSVRPNLNPYVSTKPNLPTQSFVQNHSNNNAQNPYPDFNPQSQNQGGFPDGFPRENQSQGGFPQQSQGGFPQQSQGGFPQQSQGGFPQQSQGGFPQQSQGGFPQQSQGGSPHQSQGGFPRLDNQGDSKNYANPYADNNNLPQQNNVGVFGETIADTIPISEKNESLEQSKASNKKDSIRYPAPESMNEGIKSANPQWNNAISLGGETYQTKFISTNLPNNNQPGNSQNDINQLGGITNQTMHLSIANPDNKVNPFEEMTEESKIKISGKVNPFDPNAKLQDPLDVRTTPIEEIETKKSGFNQSVQNAKNEDPNCASTFPIEEGNIKKSEKPNSSDQNDKEDNQFGGDTI